MSLTLVYASKGAPLNSPAFGSQLFRALPRICVNIIDSLMNESSNWYNARYRV